MGPHSPEQGALGFCQARSSQEDPPSISGLHFTVPDSPVPTILLAPHRGSRTVTQRTKETSWETLDTSHPSGLRRPLATSQPPHLKAPAAPPSPPQETLPAPRDIPTSATSPLAIPELSPEQGSPRVWLRTIAAHPKIPAPQDSSQILSTRGHKDREPQRSL